MFPWNPSKWTEEYLTSIIGQTESARLEFKSGRSLINKKDKEKFIEKELSPAISAFANSEGGIIIIGMDEDRSSKPRTASEVIGISMSLGSAIESPEQFQQMVDSCISPFLPGLAIRRVSLTEEQHGKYALVVYVPQGSTAYQAKDYKYYGRSEFESKPLPDHDVRLRMNRGRTPQAHLVLASWNCLTADDEFNERLDTKKRIAAAREAGEIVMYGRGIPTLAQLEAPKREYDEYKFRFAVVNSGEMTIRDFLLRICLTSNDNKIILNEDLKENCEIESFRFLKGKVVGGGYSGIEVVRPEDKLFPGNGVSFPDKEWSLRVSPGRILEPDKALIDWTVFLDDTSPIQGTIDLGIAFQDKATHKIDSRS